MLTRDEYKNLKKIVENIEAKHLHESGDLEQAISAGNKLSELFYRGFDLYLKQREKLINQSKHESYKINENYLFFDQQSDFDNWFEIVNETYYPALLNMELNELSDFEIDLIEAIGRFARFCKGIVPYVSICDAYCYKLPSVYSCNKHELVHIGRTMSAAFYLEKLSKIIDNTLLGKNSSSFDMDKVLQHCVALRKNFI